MSAIAAIGGTPVVRLDNLPGPDAAEVWVKLESANPTGSYKDRMALAMIDAAERDGRLAPGQPVVEYTGGSTGSSLAFVCAVKAIRCGSSPRTRSHRRRSPPCARSAPTSN
jgi:cysteine synthase